MKSRERHKMTNWLLLAPILLFLLIILFQFDQRNPDASPDNVGSHYILTKALQSGWNPLKADSSWVSNQNPALFPTDEFLPMRITSGIGAQSLQAFFNSALGLSHSYFIVNMLFLSTLLISTMDVIGHIFAHRSKLIKFIFFVILSFGNSVIVTQLLTGYFDVIVHCLALTTLNLFIVMLYGKINLGEYVLQLLLCVAIGVNVKISFAPIAACIILVSLLCIYNRENGNFHNAFKVNKLKLLGNTFFILSIVLTTVASIISEKVKTGSVFDSKAFRDSWNGSPFYVRGFDSLSGLKSMFLGRVDLNPDKVSFDGFFSAPTSQEILFSGFPDARIAAMGPFLSDVFGIFIFIFIMRILFEILGKLRPDINYKLRVISEKNTLDKKLLSNYLTLVQLGLLITIIFLPVNFNFRYFPQYYVFLMIELIIWSLRLREEVLLVLFAVYLGNFMIVIDSALNYRVEQARLIQDWKNRNQANHPYVIVEHPGLLIPLTGSYDASSIVSIQSCPSDQIVWLSIDKVGFCKSRVTP